MKQSVRFSPGNIAAVLFVKQGSEQTNMWIYMSKDRNPQSTLVLWHELHPAVQEQITLHFTKVFSMCYDDRAEYMKTVRPWEIQIDL
jgi:hypothetical protein